MKKIILKAAMVAAFAALSETALANVEALAYGEVDIEAICMGSTGTCIVFSDGYKIDGRRVA